MTASIMGDVRLSLPEFEAVSEAYDRAVAADRALDRFCSRSEWILPFHQAFLPGRELHLYRRGDTFVALAGRSARAIGFYLEALETMWQFACPLVGPDSVDLLRAVLARTRSERRRGGDPATPIPLLLSGIPIEGDLPRPLLAALEGGYHVRAADTTRRFVASLEGGLAGWLSRRSSSLRRNLRSAARRACDTGIGFERVAVRSAAEAVQSYQRILAIEARSWKSASGQGVDAGPMRAFYADMLPRLAARGRLRLLVATREGRDVGYLYGGLVDDHFRGLQMSFDRDLHQLSLGNLLQREMIGDLCEAGVRSYDLGSRSDYKRRWAEGTLVTVTLACRPR